MTGWKPPTTQYKGYSTEPGIRIYPFQEKCPSDNPKTIWSEVGRLNVISDLTTHPLVTPPDPPSGVGPTNVPPYGRRPCRGREPNGSRPRFSLV